MNHHARCDVTELLADYRKFLHHEGGAPAEILLRKVDPPQREKLKACIRMIDLIEGLGQLAQLEFPEDERDEESMANDDETAIIMEEASTSGSLRIAP